MQQSILREAIQRTVRMCWNCLTNASLTHPYWTWSNIPNASTCQTKVHKLALGQHVGTSHIDNALRTLHKVYNGIGIVIGHLHDRRVLKWQDWHGGRQKKTGESHARSWFLHVNHCESTPHRWFQQTRGLSILVPWKVCALQRQKWSSLESASKRPAWGIPSSLGDHTVRGKATWPDEAIRAMSNPRNSVHPAQKGSCSKASNNQCIQKHRRRPGHTACHPTNCTNHSSLKHSGILLFLSWCPFHSSTVATHLVLTMVRGLDMVRPLGI